MEPFSITCTTCGAKLKVNDEALIGQILACPKCQAMVMVQAPENRLTVGRSDVDSQALTSESIQDELHRDANFLDGPPQDAASPEENSAESIPANETPAPPADWQTSSSKGYRQIGLIAVIAIITIVSSVALFGLFVQSSIDDDVAGTNGEDVVELPPDPVEPAPPDLVEPRAAVAEPESDSNPVVGGSPVEPATEANITSPVVETTTPEMPVAASVDPERKFSNPGEEPIEPEPSAVLTELPEGLRGFADLFGPGLQLDDPSDKGEARSVTIRLDAPPKPSNRFPEPSEISDTKKRLAQPLGIDLREASLHDAILSITGLTALPITIDLRSLDSAGVDLNKKVSARILDSTADSALREIVSEVGCHIELTRPGHVAIRADEAAVGAFIAPALSLADFDDASQIIPLVRQLSIDPNDPVEIDIDAESGKLKLTGTSAAIWRAALSIEALRKSRSLPQTLPAKFTNRWLSEDPSGWESPVTGPITLEGDLERPIVDWFWQAASIRDSRILVDWPSAWQHGFTTESSGLPWKQQDSIVDLETELLSSYGLTVRDVGDGNWLMTTEFALAMSPRIVVFPGKLGQANDFLDRLSAATGFADRMAFPAIIDPITGSLIIHQPQFLLSQLPDVLAAEIK